MWKENPEKGMKAMEKTFLEQKSEFVYVCEKKTTVILKIYKKYKSPIEKGL